MFEATRPQSFAEGRVGVGLGARGVGANKAFLRSPSFAQARNHMLSEVNIVNALLCRGPLTNHRNDFPASACTRGSR